MFFYQVAAFPQEADRFFVASSSPNIGMLGPLALASAILLLVGASGTFVLHSQVRSRFSDDPSFLKRLLCLLTLAATSVFLVSGMMIIILGPAALRMMEAGLWQ